jgi:hypothetical protein
MDAVGAFATASLAAKEIDTAPGRHAAHAGPKHDICPNCSTPVPGHYCPECGQHAHVARSVRHVLHEFAHGVLHLDGKFWRTLPMLFFKPGQLTRDYIEGKRARYVAPFAIFLFTVFAMYFTFAVFGAPGNPAENTPFMDGQTLAEMSPEERAEAGANFAAQVETLTADIAALREERDEAADPAVRARLDEQIRERRFSLRASERALEGIETGNFDWQGQLQDVIVEGTRGAADSEPGAPIVSIDLGSDGEASEQAPATTNATADAATDATTDTARAGDEAATENGEFTIFGDEPSNVPALREFEKRAERWTGDMDGFWYRVKQSAYKFSFLLLPLSLPFVWLLFFWRRDIRLYDHTVFILYSLSFVSLLTISLWIALALGAGDWGLFWVLLIFLPPLHMYKQLKYGYRLSRFGALVRTFVLSIQAIIVLALFFAIVVIIGAW